MERVRWATPRNTIYVCETGSRKFWYLASEHSASESEKVSGCQVCYLRAKIGHTYALFTFLLNSTHKHAVHSKLFACPSISHGTVNNREDIVFLKQFALLFFRNERKERDRERKRRERERILATSHEGARDKCEF